MGKRVSWNKVMKQDKLNIEMTCPKCDKTTIFVEGEDFRITEATVTGISADPNVRNTSKKKKLAVLNVSSSNCKCSNEECTYQTFFQHEV